MDKTYDEYCVLESQLVIVCRANYASVEQLVAHPAVNGMLNRTVGSTPTRGTYGVRGEYQFVAPIC